MPIFLPGGPNIPLSLIQAHEDGRVVFFCGAGISIPAGLPSFKKLVTDIYEKIGEIPTDLEKSLIDQGQYDRTIGLLEERCAGGRELIRRKVFDILTPQESDDINLKTHESLLNLSKDRKGKYKLVTTNYDRFFKKVIEKFCISPREYEAPLLPICKPNKWDGIVYLHGLLPREYQSNVLQNIVISSGDFGLGYLTERWASRFISELFQNYTVCFVGYSINDPVLRYMMDALAADRLFGVDTPRAYAFADFPENSTEEAKVCEEWKSKGVTPLLYSNKQKHELLHETLRIWSETYRDGLNGKKSIITKFASRKPTEPYSLDLGVSQVLWAIRDPRIAQFFSELDPPAPFEWIEPLSEKIFTGDDLPLFGVIPKQKSNEKFSMIKRPIGFNHRNVVGLVMHETDYVRLDEIMYPIANWLAKYLEDSRLFLWIIENGAVLHENFKYIIRSSLIKFFNGKGKDNFLRNLWELLLSNKIRIPAIDGKLYQLLGDLRRNPSFGARAKELVMHSIEPCLKVSRGLQYNSNGGFDYSHEIEAMVVLRSGDAKHAIKDIEKISGWNAFLTENILELTVLLKNTFDLLTLIDSIHAKHTTLGVPSIEEHSQNEFSCEWSLLVDLLRDSWLEIAQKERSRAKAVFELWRTIDYDIFRRFELFALKTMLISNSDEAVEYLLQDEGTYLWDIDSKVETLRLLESLTTDISQSSREKLECLILLGDPNLEENPDRREFNIWQKLRKLRNILLPKSSAFDALGDLDGKFSKYANDPSLDFNSYVEVGCFDDEVKIPRTFPELKAWLIGECVEIRHKRTDWFNCCKENFSASIDALVDVAKAEKWPIPQWIDALICWADKEYAMHSWERLYPFLLDMPSPIYAQMGLQISIFLDHVAKEIGNSKIQEIDAFFRLCEKSINTNYSDHHDYQSLVQSAINHPSGMITHAILSYWGRANLSDNIGLDPDIGRLLSLLLKSNSKQSLFGKLIIGRSSINLFMVDATWFRENLLQLFNWSTSLESATFVWSGFLTNPYVHPDFLLEVSDSFIETANRLECLDKSNCYVQFLTYIALESRELFGTERIRGIFNSFSEESLRKSIYEIKGAMESADIPYDDYWNNRVTPFLSQIWPKDTAKNTPMVLESIASLCIHAKDAFPSALRDFKLLLENFHPTEYFLHSIDHDSTITTYPSECLEFLRTICKDREKYYSLREILENLESNDPSIKDREEFKQLHELVYTI